MPLLLSLASVNPRGIHPLELATLLLLVASLQVDRLLTSHLLVGLSGRAIQMFLNVNPVLPEGKVQ